MNEAGELFINAIEHWRDAKGIGTALIPAPLNDKTIVLGVLQRVYSRSPTCKTMIITTTFKERSDISEFLTQQPDSEENNKEFKKLIKDGNIKILTYDFVKRMEIIHYPLLCILYRPEIVDVLISTFINRCKFRLVVLNKLLSNTEDMIEIYKIAPILDDFKQNQIDQMRLSTPVEETQIGVEIPIDSEDYKLLEYYNEYITTSINIFGSFEIINQANSGNQSLNISPTQICYQIATENGWNEHLDMSIEFNIEIDKLYNPMSLRERASKTYEIIRLRSQFLSDYKGKLEDIFNIVQENKDKKILIINKRANFATFVAEYINNLSEKTICLPYHDKLENIPAVDINNNPIVYKTGSKKGERKFMGAQAQRTYAVQKFNRGDINILSTNNSPDKSLDIDVDVVIITSPMCEDINSYIYRLSNVNFNMINIKLFSIYCRNTIEQKQLENKSLAKNHNVKNSTDDEIYSDFVVVD